MKYDFLLVLFFSVIFLLPESASSQIIQPNRFEIILNAGEVDYTVVKGDNNNLLLFRSIKNQNDLESQLWEVLQLDTSFQIIWRNTYSIKKEFLYVKHDYHDQRLNFLFKNNTGNKTDLELITINTTSGLGVHHHIQNFIPFNLTDFKTSKYGALIGGYFNYRPLVLYYHFESLSTKVLPGFYYQKSELIQMKVNTDETVDIILSGSSFGRGKYKVLDIKTFDFKGDLISNTLLDSNEDKSLLFGRSCDWKEDTKLIAGTYGRRNSQYSRGLFLANINKYGEHHLNFYNYGDLKNFFNYMKVRREKRVRSRIQRRKIKNKKIKFNYRLLIHDVFEKDGEYIMLGEAFYPKYIYGTTIGLSRRSRTETIFDGYRYTHAVVLGFDSKGKLLWDNSFEITDVKTFEMEQFVKASVEDDRIVLLYVYDNVIRSKIIKENEVLEGKKFNELKLKFENDVITNDYNNKTNGLEKWYEKTFFAYGVENIKNIGTTGVAYKRKVFFLNKIVY